MCLQVLTILSGIGQSAYKMCGDLRLLANLKEVEEPFSKDQVRIENTFGEADVSAPWAIPFELRVTYFGGSLAGV